MKTLLAVAVLAVPFLFSAEREFATAPKVDAAADTPVGTAPRVAAWKVDPVHSSVVFRVKHAGIANFYGTFDEVTGEVALDPESPGDGKVELAIPVASLDTRNEKRDDHVKGPDFFGAKENPMITFSSSQIENAGEGGYEVQGDLAMAGKKKTVTLNVVKTGEGSFMGSQRVGYEATFSVKRSEFGMKYGLDGGALGDEVSLTVALELIAAK